MRIIAGCYRGRKLLAPEGIDTRPTSDRVRESLFQILGSRLHGAVVLDLFAGSGALALEALSRGAEYAVLNDIAPGAKRAIQRNIEAMGAEQKAKVLSLDYGRAIQSLDQKFSLVFLDPPYRMADCYPQIAEELKERGLLTKDALIVMERAKTVKINPPAGFSLTDERSYGDTVVSFFEVLEEEI